MLIVQRFHGLLLVAGSHRDHIASEGLFTPSCGKVNVLLRECDPEKVLKSESLPWSCTIEQFGLGKIRFRDLSIGV